MALHAQLHLTVRAQLRGIDDVARLGLAIRFAALDRLEVSLPRSVAWLAVNAFRHASFEHRLRTGGIINRASSRISVVAKHALVCDPAPKIQMVGAVVTRAHRPVSALL